MIANVLKHLANEVNQFVIRKTDSTLDTSITRRVNIGNIARLQGNGEDEDANGIRGGTVLSLAILKKIGFLNHRSTYPEKTVSSKIETRRFI